MNTPESKDEDADVGSFILFLLLVPIYIAVMCNVLVYIYIISNHYIMKFANYMEVKL